jgi:hypothetical protein
VRRLALISVLILTACENPFGCKQETESLEALYNSPFYAITADIVAGYEEQGWDCDSQAIRDGQGRAVGDRWTCTKC